MGLSIHYSGSFRNGASLSEMIEEVRDIVEVYEWEYSIFEKQINNKETNKKKKQINNETLKIKVYFCKKKNSDLRF